MSESLCESQHAFRFPLLTRSSENMSRRWIWRFLRSDGSGILWTSTPHGRLSPALRRGETENSLREKVRAGVPAQASARVTHPLPGPAHPRKAPRETPGMACRKRNRRGLAGGLLSFKTQPLWTCPSARLLIWWGRGAGFCLITLMNS